MEMVELARRAVACRRWEWMAGMRAFTRSKGCIQYRRIDVVDTKHHETSGDFEQDVAAFFSKLHGADLRFKRAKLSWELLNTSEEPEVIDDGEVWHSQSRIYVARFEPPLPNECDPFPDLTDPATLGCLLALVREAWGEPLARVEGYPDGWRVYVPRVSRLVGLGPSEGAALVAALEAAP
jgi:hypothetical protein